MDELTPLEKSIAKSLEKSYVELIKQTTIDLFGNINNDDDFHKVIINNKDFIIATLNSTTFK